MRVKNNNTKEDKIHKRREWAYNPQDALMQASMHLVSEGVTGDQSLIKIGPPSELVMAASAEQRKVIDDIMARLKRA